VTAYSAQNRPGLPCERLLDAPFATLADLRKWLTHLYSEVAHASNVQRAGERAQRLYGNDVPAEVADWISMYLLLVGRCGASTSHGNNPEGLVLPDQPCEQWVRP